MDETHQNIMKAVRFTPQKPVLRMEEHIADDPSPHFQEDNVEVMMDTPQQRISEHCFELIWELVKVVQIKDVCAEEQIMNICTDSRCPR